MAKVRPSLLMSFFWICQLRRKDTTKRCSNSSQSHTSVEVPLFLGPTVLHKLDHFDEFCEFLKVTVSENLDSSVGLDELINLAQVLKVRPGQNGKCTLRHLKLLIGYFEVCYEEDVAKILPLVNWYQSLKKKPMRIKNSDIPNGGIGLFGTTPYNVGDVICYYGGNLC